MSLLVCIEEATFSKEKEFYLLRVYTKGTLSCTCLRSLKLVDTSVEARCICMNMLYFCDMNFARRKLT